MFFFSLFLEVLNVPSVVCTDARKIFSLKTDAYNNKACIVDCWKYGNSLEAYLGVFCICKQF